MYKNGILDGDVEDVDKEEAERDADSESDVAEELEVEDIGSNLKPSKDVSSCEPTDSQLETKSASGKEILQEVLEPSEHHLENVVMTSLEAVPNKEDTEIDESQSVEPWVQGLVDGEYSDLSVEERLNALVALIGVANEGNSIRIILEVLLYFLLQWVYELFFSCLDKV